MSELFDTRGVRDDAEHWDTLAERIAREATRGSRSSTAAAGPLAASRLGLIAAALLLAASLAFMRMSSRRSSPASVVELGQALAPSDDVGRAIALTGRPPEVAALLFNEPRRGAEQP